MTGKNVKTTRRARLDTVLVDRGLAPSRERSRALILSGSVLVDDTVVEKAGALVSPEARIRIRGGDHPYVSRGGLKLKYALDRFGIDVSGMTALDVGASTGGFTDCLLREGARRVFALDVGYGQLAWKLRKDDRVTLFERTNVRYFDGVALDEAIDIVTVDVSFISLKQVLPVLFPLMEHGSLLLALVKPQFEAGRSDVGKGGVVRCPAVRERVVEEIITSAADTGFLVRGSCESPIRGPAGNHEYFLYAGKP